MNQSQIATDWTIHNASPVQISTRVEPPKEFTVQRAYILDPPPPQKPRRVLVNDTLSTPIATGPGLQWTATPTYEDIIGISVRHRATVAVTAAAVESAVVPGECHHPFVIACVWRRTE